MIDRTEIREHFGAFAPTYQGEAFDAGAGVRDISASELDLVRRRLGDVRGHAVLDVGVGTGRFASALIDAGAEVIGMDLTPEMLEECERNEPRAHRVQATLGESLPFEDAAFDDAVCMRVIKYVDDWRTALWEIRRVLRPGGRLILEIANRRSAARWGYAHIPVRLESLGRASELLTRQGFRIEAIDGGTRLPFPAYRWARTDDRLRAIRAVERTSSVVLGPRVLARSLIFTCVAGVPPARSRGGAR